MLKIARAALMTVTLAAAVAVLGGCVEAQYRPASNVPKLAPYTGDVLVMQRFPAYDYQMLGTLFIDGGLAVTESTMLNALRKKAAAIGANAIVMQGKLRKFEGPDGTRTRLAAFAIRTP